MLVSLSLSLTKQQVPDHYSDEERFPPVCSGKLHDVAAHASREKQTTHTHVASTGVRTNQSRSSTCVFTWFTMAAKFIHRSEVLSAYRACMKEARKFNDASHRQQLRDTIRQEFRAQMHVAFSCSFQLSFSGSHATHTDITSVGRSSCTWSVEASRKRTRANC